MSNYTKSTNFATKDNLTPGDPLKVVRGTEIDTEFNNIATAVATKTDNSAAAITGGAIDGATVGATTPATGSFTTLAASGTTTLAGALVGAATQSAFNTVSTTLNLGGAATAVNLGAATGTATVNNTTLAAKAITASTTLAVTGTSTLTGAVTATAGVSGPITSSSVSITGGSITGITDLAVADGGTGASTAAGGLNNLLPSQTSNANKYLQTDGTNASWDAVSLSTADITGTLGVANGGTGVTTSTGTTNVVLSNSPTLVTPALGTPSAAVLTNATGLPISTGVSGLGTGVATLLATPSSANLASAITDETGTGSLVFATSPTLVTPILGTPTSGTLTNATGLPISTGVSGLGTGVATFLATPSSANLAAALTDETGSGANVFATSPTLVTPILGTPTSATLTNATGLPLTTGVTGTLPTANGGTNLTSFTSGGVVYASSTSALATGSALNFNGTTLTSTSAGRTFDGNGTGARFASSGTSHTLTIGDNNFAYFQFFTPASPTYLAIQYQASEIMRLTSAGLSVTGSATANSFIPQSSTVPTNGMYLGSANNVTFAINSTRTMDLTSTGLGIGTSSPVAKVQGTRDGAPASSGNLVAPVLASAGDGSQGLAFGASSGDYTWIQSAYTNNAGVSAGSLRFYMGATERARFPSAGGFQSVNSISVGNATPTTSGAGITFPATQSASSDANTLDDYEEGTWTPVPNGLTVVGTPTYTGYYTKIGRIVYFSMNIVSTTTTASTADTTTFSAAGFPVSVNAGGAFGTCTAVNRLNTGSLGVGQVVYSAGSTFIFTPTWAASANVLVNGFFITS